MTLDQILIVIGQIATWATVALVFLTLREMQKQRKASQQPDLILPKVPLRGYSIKGRSELLVPTEWSHKELKEGERLVEDFPHITLHNVGFGAAKNIKLKWHFDSQGILETIKDYCYQNAIPIVANIQGEYLRINLKDSITMTGVDNFTTQEHEYLMPASVTSRGLRSYLPPAFMGLLSVWVYMLIHQADKREPPPSPKFSFELPSANLELSYEDVGNVRYTKKFEVRFAVVALTIPRERSDRVEVVQSVFEFIEKS
jgi:hypothetical protein